ncbi:MAG: lipopolysaccharide transport periplasmic protein LptA [Gemmobacter sp.]|nr:lipopolysaccharide transport periplasmic protein LptA [Gemmobacter sp.]
MSTVHARLSFALAIAMMIANPVVATAQGVSVGFSGLRQDTSVPIEVTADELTVDQGEGKAVFNGNVLVVQGDLRMTSGKVEVEYGADGTGISQLTATGGVTVVTAQEAAESAEAVYTIASGALVMSGAVLLTQGPSTISGERLVADLTAGTGRMEGRVKTVFQPAAKKGN